MFNQPPVTLTTKDFRAILDAFLREGGWLDTQYGSRKADFRENSVSMAALEFLATIGEVYHFSVNKETAESNLMTAREPDNIILLARRNAYEPRLPTAAVGEVTFTPKASAPPGAYIIRKGHIFKTDPNYGETVIVEAQETKIQSSGLPVTVEVAEGQTVVDADRRSTGVVGRKTLLLQYPVIQDSVQVLVGGTVWTQVDNFLDSSPGSTHYRVVTRETVPGVRRTYIEYGNGTNGLYPALGSVIQVSYRIGGGVRGNVPAGWITVPESSILTVFGGSTVDGILTNSSALSGGTDQESVDDIRLNAIGPIVTNTRVVSNEDYGLAARMQGAARAKAITKDDWSALDENTVVVWCATELGTAMTTTALDALRTSVLNAYPKCGTTRVLFTAAQFETFDVTVNVVVATGSDVTTIYIAVVRLTQAFLSFAATIAAPSPRYVVDIGEEIYPSWLEGLIGDLDGVVAVQVLFDGGNSVFTPSVYKIPQANTPTYNLTFES